MKIYDCFNFFNELDILELRLNILDGIVDYFVIVESNLTHTGVPKNYLFLESKARFEKFLRKVIHVKVEDNPTDFTDLPKTEDPILDQIYGYIKSQKNRFNPKTQNDYGRDFFQKESVRRGLSTCDANDLIMISDVDEIPNPISIVTISKNITNEIYSLNQPMYYYYLNLLKDESWYGTKVSRYETIANTSFNEVRGDEQLSKKVPKAGWHFSFMGGRDMVLSKLFSYSARDLVTKRTITELEHNMKNGIDPFHRGRLRKVAIDDSYPDYLLKNIEKYKHLIQD
jgi:beta-1,4-mannosyl-glycoprotein beta-1,4-N-acetylglucosaminyltransferase